MIGKRCKKDVGKDYYGIPKGIGVISFDVGYLEDYAKLNKWTQADIDELFNIRHLGEYYECSDFLLPTQVSVKYALTRNISSFGALRELIQNSLDAVEETGVSYSDLQKYVKVKYDPTKKALIIEDFGSGLLPSGFTFAPIEKPSWMRGHFGEGLKFALAKLLIDGYGV